MRKIKYVAKPGELGYLRDECAYGDHTCPGDYWACPSPPSLYCGCWCHKENENW